MQYLPIYPEKSWKEVMLGTSDYTGYPLDEHLPLANGLGKAWNELPYFPENIYPRTMLGVAMPFAAAADVFGGIGNTALNGYKRAYNYGANAYNNLVDRYNNYQMQRHLNYAPGNSNTGRRIVGQPTIPTLQQNLPTRATRYLVGPNGNIVAQIVD